MDKNALFAKRLPEDDVQVPGIGTVRVRGLSRAEASAIQKLTGTEKFERTILVFGMVDPALTEAEVAQWLDAAAYGELEPVLTRIGELSGLMEDSAKKAVKDFVAEPDSEFPVLPSPEAGADSGGTGGNEQ